MSDSNNEKPREKLTEKEIETAMFEREFHKRVVFPNYQTEILYRLPISSEQRKELHDALMEEYNNKNSSQ